MKIPNCMKISPLVAELLRVDGRTDMTKLTVAFRNFANAPKHDSHFDTIRIGNYILRVRARGIQKYMLML